MQYDFAQLMAMLVDALTPFFIALASWAAYHGAAWLKMRTTNDKARAGIDIARVAVSDVVMAGGEAFQAALRKATEDGVITPEEMAEIRAASLAATKAQAGAHAIAALQVVTADVDEYLWTKIKAEAHFALPVMLDSGAAPDK